MSILKPNYRTYVLNDFSAVAKAVFYVLKRDTKTGGYKVITKLPVQINPSRISGKVGESRNKFVKDMRREGEASLKSHKEGDEDNKYEITLTYDIYDEYNTRTMNGISNASLINGMSLFDQETTTLEKLKMLAGDFTKKVLFLWGDIQIFGLLEEVQFEYTAFSRWGNPLKAEATVSIKKIHLGYERDLLEMRIERQPLENLKLDTTTIKASQKSESIAVTAAAAIDALR